MKKITEHVKYAIKCFLEDPWIMILDIIAVNLSYWVALMIRYRVNEHVNPGAVRFVRAFWQFAPFYTGICVLVFVILRLYGGMWKYAGFNDLNRIIEATAVTGLLYVICTNMFVVRMPVSVYGLGTILQFFALVAIRFGYRFLLVEKRRLKRRRQQSDNAVIIGGGLNGTRVIRYLEEETALRPVLIVDASAAGKTLDGVPVAGMDRLEATLDEQAVHTVILADPLIDAPSRQKVAELCERSGAEFRDFAGYLSFLEEPESGILEVVKGTTVKVGGEEKRVIPFSPPDIGESEIQEVTEALRSGWITTGPRTKLLERRLAAYIKSGNAALDTESAPDTWSNRVVCLNSATAAEELNLRILGIGPGDEVIVPAYTYTASASAAIHCGATVRFVDIQPGGDPVTHMPEMDYDALEKAITEKTKAVVTVDLGGIVCDYDRIFEIVWRKRGLFRPMESDGTPLGDLSAKIQRGLGCVAVVADCAHSLGASRTVTRSGKGTGAGPQKRWCGDIAHFTSFSFHAVKNFTTAEGGASAWCLPTSVYDTGVTNAEIYKFYQLLSLHGQNKDALAKTKVGAWEYDIIGPWYKCNMTDIMAAIGLRQLDRYPGLLERREVLMKKYDAVCEELGLSHMVHHVPGMDSSNHLYLVRVPGFEEPQRNALIEAMAKAGVATNVHYKPLPMMTAYKALGWDIRDFPNTYDYYRNLITLPFHTLLSDEDADYVCDTLRNVMKEVRA